MKYSLWLIIMAFLSFVAISCQNKKETLPSDSNHKLKIVTTTGMIKDAALQVAGDKAEVTALMGTGVDPHQYKATQGDLTKLSNADVIFYNGLMLEGKMQEVLGKIGQSKTSVAVAEAIPQAQRRHISIAGSAENASHDDPHVWFDVTLWQIVVNKIAETLANVDTANAAYYRQNAKTYTQQLQQLNEEVKQSIAQIPAEQRLLITSHDAFGYFGKAYNLEVRGLQGISTVAEFGLRDIADITNLLITRKIKAVFVESSVPQKSLEAVIEGCRSKGHQVVIGGTLFSDAMGAANTPEGTYIGMVKYNTQHIVSALK